MFQALPLYAKGKQQIQSISGTLLYYSKIDTCIKPALIEISSKQSAPTKDTNTKATIIFEYLSTYPGSIRKYHAINMVLIYETDASHLVLPEFRSRATTWFIMATI